MSCPAIAPVGWPVGAAREARHQSGRIPPSSETAEQTKRMPTSGNNNMTEALAVKHHAIHVDTIFTSLRNNGTSQSYSQISTISSTISTSRAGAGHCKLTRRENRHLSRGKLLDLVYGSLKNVHVVKEARHVIYRAPEHRIEKDKRTQRELELRLSAYIGSTAPRERPHF